MEIRDLRLDEVTPGGVWRELDDETRTLAASAMYDDGDLRQEADAAIALGMRFREVTVRRMAVKERVRHLLRGVRTDDALASSLLLALHLHRRGELLRTFLDQLEIPHDNGLIDAEYDISDLDQQRVTDAVNHLYGNFAEPEVDLYLVSLIALDPETWAGVKQALEQRLGS